MSGIERFRKLLGEATERPWHHEVHADVWDVLTNTEYDAYVARDSRKNDAALIVQAVNAAETLLDVAEAAQSAKWDMEDGPAFRRLDAALARLDEELER
jgi:hypothetical protein